MWEVNFVHPVSMLGWCQTIPGNSNISTNSRSWDIFQGGACRWALTLEVALSELACGNYTPTSTRTRCESKRRAMDRQGGKLWFLAHGTVEVHLKNA